MKKRFFLYLFFLIYLFIGAQEVETFIIKGKVTNTSDKAISNVNLKSGNFGTITNKKGAYKLYLTLDNTSTIQIIASHQGYKNDTTFINLNNEKTIIKNSEFA